AMADVVKTAGASWDLFLPRRQMLGGVLPLLDEKSAMRGEGRTQTLRNRDQGAVQALPEGKRQHKLRALPDIDFAGQGDVAVRRAVEVPRHPEVACQVLPPVGRSHITAGAVQKRDRGGQHEPGSVFMC